MKAKIHKPCSEDWNNMKIGVHSRHCESCERDVIDLTKMNRGQILEYLVKRKSEQVCGRIYRSQMDLGHQDIPILVEKWKNGEHSLNKQFYILSLSALLMASCTDVSQEVEQDNIHVEHIDSVELQSTITDADIHQPDMDSMRIGVQDLLDIDQNPVFGEIRLIDDTLECFNGVHILVDTMPEFPGGIDSLMAFIKKNLKYPEWEAAKNFQGTVYATFIVGKDGGVGQERILRSVNGSKNMDSEVLRILGLMPDWIPGIHNGKNVDVSFNIPIKFTINK